MSSKKVHFVDSKRATRATRGAREEGTKKRTKHGRRKPEWDTTVNDLSVYRLTKEELERRHKSHQSKNAEVAKHDLYEKAKGSYDLDSTGNLRPSPLSSSGRKLAALQKSLHGKELHEVLAESDRALRVVKDLFGDDPKRYTCQPNVTVAPHVINDKKMLERTLLENQRDGPAPTAMASPGGIRDESVMEIAPRKPALNELPSPTPSPTASDIEADDEDMLTPSNIPPPSSRTHPPPFETTPTQPNNITGGYQTSVDLKRFQTLLEREEQQSSSNSKENRPHLANRMPQRTSKETVKQREYSTTVSRPKQNTKHTLHVHIPSESHDNLKQGRVEERDGRHGGEDDDQQSLTGISELSSIRGDGDRMVFEVEEEGGEIESEGSGAMMKDKPKDTTEKMPARKHSKTDFVAASDDLPPGHCKCEQCELIGERETFLPPSRRFCSLTCCKRYSTEKRYYPYGRDEQGNAKSIREGLLHGHPLHVVHKKPVEQDHQVQTQPQEAPDQDKNDQVHNDLQMLEKLVLELDRELHEYEKATSFQVPHDSNNPHSSSKSAITKGTTKPSGTLSGITASLLSSVRKMTHYLKQSEIQLKGEIAVRGQLLQTMTEQQNLMDALTMDLVKVREENVSLRNEITEVKQSTSEQMRKMQDELSEVHKKLSSVAIQQIQSSSSSSHHPHYPLPPPSSTYHPPTSFPYLSPLVPTLPPQIQHPGPSSTLPKHPPFTLKNTTPLSPQPSKPNTGTQSTHRNKQSPLHSTSGMVPLTPYVTTAGSNDTKTHTSTANVSHSTSSALPLVGCSTPSSASVPQRAVSGGVVYAQVSPLVQDQEKSSDKQVASELVKGRQEQLLCPTSDPYTNTSWRHLTISSDTIYPKLQNTPFPTDTKAQHLPANFRASHPTTKPHSTSFTPLKPLSSTNPTLDASYAPSPPPLSIALQIPVPSLSMDTTMMTDTSLRESPLLHLGVTTATGTGTCTSKSQSSSSPLKTETQTVTQSSLAKDSKETSITKGTDSTFVSNQIEPKSGIESTITAGVDKTTSVTTSLLPTFDVDAFLKSLGKLGEKNSLPSQPSASSYSQPAESSSTEDGAPSTITDSHKSSSTSLYVLPSSERLTQSKAHLSLSPIPENCSTLSDPVPQSSTTDIPTSSSTTQSLGIDAQEEMVFHPLETTPSILRQSSSDYSTVSLPVGQQTESERVLHSNDVVGGSKSAGSLPVVAGSGMSHKTGWFALSSHLSQ